MLQVSFERERENIESPHFELSSKCNCRRRPSFVFKYIARNEMKTIMQYLFNFIKVSAAKTSLLHIKWHLAIGCLIRFVLIGYGIWQDLYFDVKYTDIDYSVFTDAAKHVVEGLSPYKRHTYRYTPLLAYFLTPNILLSFHFGKFVFVVFDLLTAFTIFKIVQLKHQSRRLSTLCSMFWLYNPLSITICTRGNAESIITFLVLFSLLTCLKRHLFFAAMLYGIAIHTKIYPIIYAPSIYLNLASESFTKPNKKLQKIKNLLLPNSDQILFALVSILTLASLTSIFYFAYDWPFIQEAYLYHISRKDTRHNFSLFFYLLYLTADLSHSTLIGLITFLPQIILILAITLVYFADLPFCWFLLTVIFVMFNKVCTSQYFLWYLCLLPLLLPSLQLTVFHGLILILLWFLGQGIWLLPAYFLEFEGSNTFIYICLASVVFFFIQTFILYILINKYVFSKKKIVKNK
ncbi:GPI mannosyltransferase 1 [Octopus sinensis]|nr:GPI mannosyltransferase 1 [Octopus sinensis]